MSRFLMIPNLAIHCPLLKQSFYKSLKISNFFCPTFFHYINNFTTIINRFMSNERVNVFSEKNLAKFKNRFFFNYFHNKYLSSFVLSKFSLLFLVSFQRQPGQTTVNSKAIASTSHQKTGGSHRCIPADASLSCYCCKRFEFCALFAEILCFLCIHLMIAY